MDAPYHLKQPVDRKHMYEVFGCDWSQLREVHARVGALEVRSGVRLSMKKH